MQLGTYDAHTHTTFSDGRTAVVDNVRQAEACSLEAIVIADHIYDEPEWFGQMLEEVEAADAEFDVKVLAGGEGVILNPDGEISIPEHVAQQLDFILVDFGGKTEGIAYSAPASIEAFTENVVSAICKACENPLVDAIAHPLNLGRFPAALSPVDFGATPLIEMATTFAKTGTAFEVMNQMPWWFPNLTVKRITNEYADVLRVFKRYGVAFVLGSDAHSCGAVGNLRWCFRVMEMAGIDASDLIDLPMAGERRGKR